MVTPHLSEEDLQKMPSSVRDKIINYLEKNIEKENKAVQQHSFRFTFEGNEVDRSACLAASGEVRAYKKVLKLFK